MTRYVVLVLMLSGCAANTQELERQVAARRTQMSAPEKALACSAARDEARTACVWIGPVNHDCDRAQVKLNGFCY